MNAFQERYGPWALVAGASEGIGAEFARQIARRGIHLLLVARREAALMEEAARIRDQSRVEVRTVAADLGARDVLDTLAPVTAGLEIGLVVYNAAHSVIGEFLDQPLADHLRTLDVNCRGPLLLAHEYGGAMARRGRGGIILMSSLAGLQGSPLVATYGATKAFNLMLAEALWDELGARHVDVLACRAGATRTPAYERSRPRANTAPLMEPAPVVASALAALGRRPSVVPGALNRVASFVMGRLLPRSTAIRTIGNATRKMYPARDPPLPGP